MLQYIKTKEKIVKAKKVKYTSLCIMCALLGVLFFGCADQRLLYKNLAFGIKLKYSPQWERKEYQGETLAMFLLPSQENELFTKSVNIAIQDLDPGITLGSFTQGVLETVKMMGQMPGAYLNIKSQGHIRIGRRNAYQIIYALTQYGLPQEAIDAGFPDEVDTKGQSFQIWQAWTIHNQRAYIFTYLASQEMFDTAKEEVLLMLNSVELF